jgi:hypothetical protein
LFSHRKTSKKTKKKNVKETPKVAPRVRSNPIQNVQFNPDSKKWVLRGCKRPRTLSFAIASMQNEIHNEEGEINKGVSATLSDVDRFLSENFSSLYISDDDGNYHKGSDHRSKRS